MFVATKAWILILQIIITKINKTLILIKLNACYDKAYMDVTKILKFDKYNTLT